MNARWSLLILAASILAACRPAATPAAAPEELVVFAASSLTGAFTDLAASFQEANPGVAVALNFASSTNLATQLAEGVPADVFASANPAQMQVAIDAGRITAGSEAYFVTNQLTIIVPADNPAGIESFEDLSQDGIALVLAVAGVPVRDYTDDIVATMPAGFQTAFYANLVSEEENVRQVAAKIALGEADAGLVYASDVTPDLAGQILQIAIPDEQNVIARYPIAPVADSAHAEAARLFIDFVLGAEGQAILAIWGFGPAPAE